MGRTTLRLTCIWSAEPPMDRVLRPKHPKWVAPTPGNLELAHSDPMNNSAMSWLHLWANLDWR